MDSVIQRGTFGCKLENTVKAAATCCNVESMALINWELAVGPGSSVESSGWFPVIADCTPFN